MSKTFLTNRLLLTAKHTCWMLHIIIFHSQFVVQYSNKCLASLPKCVNKCLALLSKIFLPIFYKCLLYIHGQVQNVVANASLCIQNIQNKNAWNPKCLGKSWTEALFCIQSHWTNALIHIQDDGTNGLLLQMPSFTKPAVHPKRSNKSLCFISKIFEAILLFIQSVWTNALVRIQNVSK